MEERISLKGTNDNKRKWIQWKRLEYPSKSLSIPLESPEEERVKRRLWSLKDFPTSLDSIESICSFNEKSRDTWMTDMTVNPSRAQVSIIRFFVPWLSPWLSLWLSFTEIFCRDTWRRCMILCYNHIPSLDGYLYPPLTVFLWSQLTTWSSTYFFQ